MRNESLSKSSGQALTFLIFGWIGGGRGCLQCQVNNCNFFCHQWGWRDEGEGNLNFSKKKKNYKRATFVTTMKLKKFKNRFRRKIAEGSVILGDIFMHQILRMVICPHCQHYLNVVQRTNCIIWGSLCSPSILCTLSTPPPLEASTLKSNNCARRYHRRHQCYFELGKM